MPTSSAPVSVFRVELNGGAFSKVYSLQHTNPYTSIDGVSRTESLTYRDVTQFVSSSSNFSSKTVSGGVTWDYPITEFQYVRVGGSIDSSQLLTNSLGSALQAQQWVQHNGHPYQRIAHDDASNNEYVFYGTNFHSFEGLIGWGWDTRNRTLFADRGMRQTLSLSSTVPGSNVQYWVGSYNFLQYVPIYRPDHLLLPVLGGLRRAHRQHDGVAAVPELLRWRTG